MEYTTLGRTGLRVSVMGLGGGGHSRLGLAAGADEAHAADIVRRALELGVNFIDTAEIYRTESPVGQAIAGLARDTLVISTKTSITRGGELVGPDRVAQALEASLGRLGTDYVDVYHLHAVRDHHYDYAVERIVPAMMKLRDQGKIRFLGITEHFGHEPGHEMMSRAVRDDCWDVVMVGFSILNQCARQRVLPQTIAKDIGVLVMFAVRRALSRPQRLRQLVAELIEQGRVDGRAVDADNPLGFLLRDGGAASVPEAAYRFCRHEPGVHVVLAGTGRLDHLDANAASILRGPLPPADLARLNDLFARVDSVSGN